MSLDGDLEEVSISTLLQMLLVERHRVAVLLRRPGSQGTFFLDNGVIVHATLGNLEGKAAAMELLSWKAGRFRVLKSTPVPNPTLGGDPAHLFLEACRRQDEAKGNEKAAAERKTLSRDAQGRLREKLLSLMGRLERGLSELRSPRVQRQPIRELQILVALIEEAQDFLRRFPSPRRQPTLKDLLEEAMFVHPMLRLVFARKHRLSLRVAKRLYRDWEEEEEERSHLFRQLRRGLVALLELQLELLAEPLADPGPQDEWQETCSVFFGELRECVEAVPI